jgi:uncharacterized protein (TIGR03435 family)
MRLLVKLGHALLGTALVYAADPAFDVTSVKASTAIPPRFNVTPGRLLATGASLSDLIQQAYGISDLQISGIPERLGLFDVEGKAEGSHSRGELREMLKTLLAERFHLAVHREVREMTVDALVAAKNGPKLQPAAADVDPLIAPKAMPTPGAAPKILVVGQNITLPMLANYLSNRLHRIVVDKTGLLGNFDFSADLTENRFEYVDPDIPEREAARLLITDAVSKLGLKFESQKAPVEVLVVDHVEKPDAN